MRHALALLLAATLLTACSSDPSDPQADETSPVGGSTTASPGDDDGPAPGMIRSNVKRGAKDVPVDTLLKVTAQHGRLSTVTVTGWVRGISDMAPRNVEKKPGMSLFGIDASGIGSGSI